MRRDSDRRLCQLAPPSASPCCGFPVGLLPSVTYSRPRSILLSSCLSRRSLPSSSPGRPCSSGSSGSSFPLRHCREDLMRNQGRSGYHSARYILVARVQKPQQVQRRLSRRSRHHGSQPMSSRHGCRDRGLGKPHPPSAPPSPSPGSPCPPYSPWAQASEEGAGGGAEGGDGDSGAAPPAPLPPCASPCAHGAGEGGGRGVHCACGGALKGGRGRHGALDRGIGGKGGGGGRGEDRRGGARQGEGGMEVGNETESDC
ncbi:unnamed protein product [Closterium sp. NIES-53]